MKNKRAISLCMLLFSLFNFTACEKTENAEVKVDLFDNEKALNISKDYLFNIKNGQTMNLLFHLYINNFLSFLFLLQIFHQQLPDISF